MAKQTDRTAYPLVLPANGGYILGVDPADTSKSPQGSTKAFFLDRLGKTFETREAFEAAVAAGYSQPNGNTTVADGLAYKAQSGATAFSDLPGWVPAERITANHFGFSTAGTATANRDAIEAALVWANGAQVFVLADSDFACSQWETNDIPVNLHYEGGGWQVATGDVFNALNSYDNIQPISSFTPANIVIEGEGNNLVIAIAVPDASGYSRGDVVKIVSDDIDPAAASNSPRRIGEFAEVVQTASGIVYVNAVEDLGEYVTNPRIGRLKPNKVKITGLRVKSSEANTGTLYQITNGYFPEVEAEHTTHGRIAMNNSGSYHAVYRLKGNGFTNSSNALGYLLNDENSQSTRAYLEGARYRHLYTDNFASADAGDMDLGEFGGTRDAIVTGIASQCWGSPFDTHPGSRRAKFLDCQVRGMMNGYDNPHAFDTRGADVSIINPLVDDTPSALIRVSDATRGTILVSDPRIRCKPVESDNTSGNRPTVIWSGGHVSLKDGFSFFTLRKCTLRITASASFKNTDIDRSFASFIDVYDSSVYLDGPVFDLSYAAGDDANHRFIRLRNAAADERVIGSFRLRQDSDNIASLVYLDGGTPTAFIKCLIEKGDTPAAIFTGGVGTRESVVVNLEDSAQNDTSVASLAEYLASVGAF